MSEDSKTFSLSLEGVKNFSLVLSILATLGGAITYAANKLVSYDNYATRIAKLEARDESLTQVSNYAQTSLNDRARIHEDLNSVTKRVNDMSGDMLQMRLAIERFTVILEHRR